MMEDKKHPKSWAIVPLGDFVENEKGKKPKKQKERPDQDFIYPYVDIEAFEKGNIRSWTDGEGCRLCHEGDFLMVWDGSRSGLVGKGMNGALGSTLVRINFPKINNHYAFYFLQSKFLEINTRAKGVGIPHVDPNLLWNYGFPIAPTNEQKRIVAKIEELFSELDKGIESLKTARAQLKIYRQAVLKHAFEGKLTADWREDNKDKLEPADELLERIKQEREQCYQQQLEEWQSAVKTWEQNGKEGKKPTKPRQQKDIPGPSAEELQNFANLPAEWKWVKLGELVWSVKDGPHYTPKYSESGIPFITGGNIRQGSVDFESAKFISKTLHQELSARCKPEVGDILYTKGGTTGIAHVNTYEFEFNVWVHVAVLKITESLQPFYLQHALNSPNCYAQSQKYTHGVGNQDLGLTRMVNIILPLCSEAEQKQIIDIFEELTSKFDEIERAIEEQLQKSESLRQSILKKAFSGQLVVQDPADEPASALLERIKAEKDKVKKRGKKVA